MINLLPPKEKEMLVWEERQRMSILIGIILFVFLLSLTLVLLIGEFRIRGEAEGEKFLLEAEKKAFEGSGFREVQAKADAYQRMLVSLSGFIKQESNFSLLAEALAQALPGDTYLTFFSYNREDGSVQISGFAPERTDLFSFKQHLEQEPFFESVDFPPTNWIRAADINFQATLKIISK